MASEPPENLGRAIDLWREAYQQQKALFEERYGLNKPLYVQIWTYIVKAVTFNFGPSFQTPSVLIQDMVRERLKGTSPATQRGVLAGGALSFYGMN